MVKININIQKKDLWLISAIFVFLVGVGLVIGAWDTGKTMFHNSEDVKVTIDSLDYSLQEALDDGLIGGGMSFGSWITIGTLAIGGTETMVVNNVYQSQTDGIITVYGVGSHGGGSVRILTGGNNPPTTRRTGEGAGYVNYGHGASSPVKSGDYFMIEVTGSWDTTPEIYWLPIISSGGSGA